MLADSNETLYRERMNLILFPVGILDLGGFLLANWDVFSRATPTSLYISYLFLAIGFPK